MRLQSSTVRFNSYIEHITYIKIKKVYLNEVMEHLVTLHSFNQRMHKFYVALFSSGIYKNYKDCIFYKARVISKEIESDVLIPVSSKKSDQVTSSTYKGHNYSISVNR